MSAHRTIGHVAIDSGHVVIGDPHHLADHGERLRDSANVLAAGGEPISRLDFVEGCPDAPKGVAGLVIPTGGDHVFPSSSSTRMGSHFGLSSTSIRS
jgi:hypothetical protein